MGFCREHRVLSANLEYDCDLYKHDYDNLVFWGGLYIMTGDNPLMVCTVHMNMKDIFHI